MIFVTVGTSTFPFDRLLRHLDTLDLGDDLVAQYGASAYIPQKAAATQAFMSYDEIAQHMADARTVITHGGAGSIITALHLGIHPVVVPRRQHYGEVVDEHQAELGARLSRAGLVTLVDVGDLTPELMSTGMVGRVASAESPLAADVSAFVESVLAVPAR